MNVKRLLAASMVCGAAAFGVGACNVHKHEVFQPEFWQQSADTAKSEAENGFAALATGQADAAKNHFEKALQADPKNVQALMGTAILHQARGENAKAAQLYQQVLALDPSPDETMFSWDDMAVRPVAEVAKKNLALIKGARKQPLRTKTASTAVEDGEHEEHSNADDNVVSRFETLRQLRDLQLITTDEYVQRRNTNIGALLPLTSPPPAAGLDRPAPEPRQIVGRLQAIGKALQMRAISPAQHAAERTMILEALLPETPRVKARPATHPQDAAAKDEAMQRLAMLQDTGHITADEYYREQAAIEHSGDGLAHSAQPAHPQRSAHHATRSHPSPEHDAHPITAKPISLTDNGPGTGDDAGMSASKSTDANAGSHGVHLASFRSRQEAARSWAQIRRAHRKILGDLQPSIVRVDRRDGEAVYYRLFAAPVPSDAAAENLCKALKSRSQHCVPWEFETG
ncbi:MAG: SPOR domain-containing protein [Rhodospirillales bacterium]|nr:SPOR domain-containing protein [Rhodospirillales bacterium]